jgi:hypothetical protein
MQLAPVAGATCVDTQSEINGGMPSIPFKTGCSNLRTAQIHSSLFSASEHRSSPLKNQYIYRNGFLAMDTAYELHRAQLIKAYNKAVKRNDWQAARNYRDELNILVAKKVALS